mgnify:CR=1 FL=1
MKSAAQFFLAQTIKVEALFQWWSAFKQHNTKPTKKTHANQLISGKFCSLSVNWMNK